MSFRGVSHELPHESLVPLGENSSESVPVGVLPYRQINSDEINYDSPINQNFSFSLDVVVLCLM